MTKKVFHQKIFERLKKIFQQSRADIKSTNISENGDNIPGTISDDENIARFVFSPMNINSKNNTIKPNCFKPPADSDEVSVNRYDFTDEDFLKMTALEMQSPSRCFYGIAIVKASMIRQVAFDIIYTPIVNSNPFHSDIKIGHIVERDVELPAEISMKIRQLIKETRFYKDSDTSTNKWIGDKIAL